MKQRRWRRVDYTLSKRKLMGRLAGAMFLAISPPCLTSQLSQTNPADGRSAIVLTGDIERGDANRFFRYINENFVEKKRSLTALYLDSNGGIVQEGSRIAEIVHRLDVAVVVGDSAVCRSTCFLILAASNRRLIGVKASLGVHSVAADPESMDGRTAEDTPAMAETVELARLYREYGVPDSVVAGMVTTLPSSLYTLSEAEKALLRADASR